MQGEGIYLTKDTILNELENMRKALEKPKEEPYDNCRVPNMLFYGKRPYKKYTKWIQFQEIFDSILLANKYRKAFNFYLLSTSYKNLGGKKLC